MTVRAELVAPGRQVPYCGDVYFAVTMTYRPGRWWAELVTPP